MRIHNVFRREAGSYGKDVRGLNRLHEFSKVELVRIDKPEHSKQSHQEMLNHVEGLLQKLELPYRILRLCGGDMSFTAALCFDFEVYSEAQKRWLEVSSVSNFDTYQANRLKCRYRNAEKENRTLPHAERFSISTTTHRCCPTRKQPDSGRYQNSESIGSVLRL